MPDVREVYEMVTKQKAPEPGALERQQKRQVRTARNRKLGAFAVAAAIGLAVVVAIVVNRPTTSITVPAERPSPTQPLFPAEPGAVELASGFAEAVGAFDADRAMSQLSEFAEVPEGLLPEELPLLISLYEAQGYEQTLGACDVSGTSALGTTVGCPYTFHMLGSDELGRGPFRGSEWEITVKDGSITSAVQMWDIERFSPQAWEPLHDWVAETYPEDVDVMYVDGGTNFALSEESVRLWDRNVDRYVAAVLNGTAE